MTQQSVARAFREVNAAYRPFHDAQDGNLALWETLEAPTVLRWLESSAVAIVAQRSWARAEGRMLCPFGSKGDPPWAFVSCLACIPEVQNAVT